MQLACKIAVETIEGKKCRVAKESANTVFAGTVDECRIGVQNGKRDVLDETDINGTSVDGQQRMQEKERYECQSHSLMPTPLNRSNEGKRNFS